MGIEPNLAALPWFALAAAIASLSFYVLAGAFPLETRPDLRTKPVGLALVAANLLLLVALVGTALLYGLANLRWTSLVIVSGLAVLFAPGLFHLWPERWRDGVAGLAIVLGGLSVSLGLMAAVA